MVAPPERSPWGPAPHDGTTTLAAIAGDELGEGRARAGRLVVEASGFTIIGVFLARALGLEQAGLLSIFLAAGALGSRAKKILHAAEEGDGATAVRDLLALFGGTMLAYAFVAVVFGAAGTERAFGFALEAAGAGGDDLLTRPFPGALPVLGHNLAVLAAVVVLSLVYRIYGALLALTWNAAVWGVVLVYLGFRVTAPSEALAVALGVLPHLGLEAFAYVVGGLAGARVGRGLTMQVKFHVPLRAFGLAAASLALAAVLESQLPRWVAGRVSLAPPREAALAGGAGAEPGGAEPARRPVPAARRSPGCPT